MMDDGTKLTTQEFWDAQWRERDARRGLLRRLRDTIREREYSPNGVFLRVVRRELGALTGQRLLELGGGGSRFAVALARAGAEVTVLDYSPEGLRQSERLADENGVEIRTVKGDLFIDGEADPPYDIAMHFGLLEHFTDPLPVLQRTAAVLRPGGMVFFTMPNLAAVGAALWRRGAPLNFSHHHYHDDAAVREAGAAAGFTDIRTFAFGVPLIRMAPQERGGIAWRLADLAHGMVVLLAAVMPGIFASGPLASPAIASNRGFVARRT